MAKSYHGTGVFLIGPDPGATYRYQMVSRCGETVQAPVLLPSLLLPEWDSLVLMTGWYILIQQWYLQLVSSGLSEQAMLMVMNVAGQQVYGTMITNDNQTIT